MTTFALIAGMIPVALGAGRGRAVPRARSGSRGDRRRDHVSTLLTLLVIPTFYEIPLMTLHGTCLRSQASRARRPA
jgi:hydrophobic/amphiphilic exporter-1 (mainly G- bacteria), HAE1 family